MIKIPKIKIILVVCTLSIIAVPAFAAETFFETENPQIRVGDKFEVGFFLNTESQDINAVESRVVFPASLLRLKEIRDGNSIVNFWIERPKAINGEILFSGIIPGGYFDKRGLIFSLVFQAIQEGQGSIEIRDIKTLINDGQGTEAKTAASNLQFVISKQALPSQPATTEKKDKNIPEAFEPVVTSDPAIFDGKYFLVFSAQDKESGIDRYEIQENRKQEIKDKKWTIGESPYLLKDQGLHSYIYVKAVDKSGNERIVMLPPQKPLSWYQNYWILAIMIIAAAIYLIWKILWKKRRK